MKMLCPNCGKEYNEKMTCCISCGASLIACEPDSDQILFEPLIPEAVPDEASQEITSEEAGPEHDPEETSEHSEAEPHSSEDIPAAVSRRGNLSAVKAVKNIGSFAAAAVMLFFLLLTALSLTVRLITDSSKIAEFADSLDVMSLPAAETGMISTEGYDIAQDATLQEAIYVMSTGTGLTRENIREIYESSTVSEFLASQLGGYADFIREGDLPEKLTTEKLKALFSENIDLISQAIGKPLSQHDIDLAFSELDRTENVLETIAPSNIESIIGNGSLTAVRLFSSLPVIIGEGCAAAAMLIILWAINRRPGRVLGWGGSAVLAGGATILLTTFLCSVQVFFADQDRFFRSIAKCAADVIAPDIYRFGGTLAAVGIVMLLWAATLHKSRKAN